MEEIGSAVWLVRRSATPHYTKTSTPWQAPLCAPLRSASVAPRAGSALLGGSLRLTPLLAGRSETEAEAQVAVVAVGGPEPVPMRGTGVDRRVAPGTTARDAVGA